jgi:hypothetical protein
MPSFPLRQLALCIPLIVGYLPLAAQSSSYHLEFESQGLVLVNDSEKVIEAYMVREACDKFAGFTARILYVGTHGGRSAVIKSGERRNLGISRPDDQSCDQLVDAVIFADGSFEGKEAAVRSLKAHSDGIAASVNYWVDRISRENPDGSTLASLLDEIKRRIANDKAQAGRYPAHLERETPPPLWEYWEGRWAVDHSLEERFQREWTAMKADEALHRARDYMVKRKADIDGDEGLQKLNTAFPPIAEPGRIVDKTPDGSAP